MTTSEELQRAAQVQYDTWCVRCSYNLRTLDVEGNCPECGTPVGCSLEARRLPFADPAFLRKLQYRAAFGGAAAAGISMNLQSAETSAERNDALGR